jgi:ribitol 2-dehydrogenase
MTALHGKVAVITGASSGIGRAYAVALAAEGCRLVLVGRRLHALELVAASLSGEIEVVAGDIADVATSAAVVEAAVTRFGRVDLVLSNAGIYVAGDFTETSAESIHEIVGTNVFGAIAIVRAALPYLLESKGDVLFTSSVSGHQSIHWEPVYSATKHAVQAFAHGLRRQLADSGVRVMSIAPGVVLNELWGYSDGDERSDDMVASARGIRSDDVADAMVFMLSRPRHVTLRDLVILPTGQDI